MSAEIIDDEVVIDMADYFANAPRLAPAEALALAGRRDGDGRLRARWSALSSRRSTSSSQALLPEGAEVIDVDLAAEPELVDQLEASGRSELRCLALTYTSLSRDETTEREVEPWSVFSSLGNWYLHGHCRLAGDRSELPGRPDQGGGRHR